MVFDRFWLLLKIAASLFFSKTVVCPNETDVLHTAVNKYIVFMLVDFDNTLFLNGLVGANN